MQTTVRKLRESIRRSLEESQVKTVVNGLTIPKGKSGDAMRTIVDYLAVYPDTPMDVLIHVADHLVSSMQSPKVLSAGLDKLWTRRQGPSPRGSRQVWRYSVMPGAEVLRGTSSRKVSDFPSPSKFSADKKTRQDSNRAYQKSKKDKLSQVFVDKGFFPGTVVRFDAERYIQEKFVHSTNMSDVHVDREFTMVTSKPKNYFYGRAVTIYPPITLKGKRTDPSGSVHPVEFTPWEEMSSDMVEFFEVVSEDDITRLTKDAAEVDWHPDTPLPEDMY